MNRMDLEIFKEILKDDSLHITIASVTRVTVSGDRSSVAIECDDILFSPNKLVCVQSWDSVGDNSCSGDLVEEEDLILVVFAGADMDHAFHIARLASKDEQLPMQIVDGHFVTKAKPGKKLYLASDTKVEIGKGDPFMPAEEPLVLGSVLQDLLADMLTQLAQLAGDVKDLASKVNSLAGNVNSLATDLSTHQHATAAPGPPSPPLNFLAIIADGAQANATGSQAMLIGTDADGIKTQLNNYKSSPVNDDGILSDIAFTEKGGII